MKKIFFNWQQLRRDADNQFSSIIILTFALSQGYNNTLAYSRNNLLDKLFIDRVSSKLFSKRFLLLTGKYRVNSTYRQNNPQSYFTNYEWLYSRTKEEHKIAYLYALAQRPIACKDNFIIDKFLPKVFWQNPFYKHEKGKIIFYLENP